MVDILEQIKSSIKDGNVIMGTERVLKSLKSKGLKRVALANNVSDEVRSEIEHFARLSDVDVEIVNMNNEELGTFCKRKHNISVLGMN